MIRVLQIMDNIKVNSGVSSIVMNLYRNIDKSQVQFDFLISTKTEMSYEDEINLLGGKVYYTNNPLSLKTMSDAIKKNLNFFKENSDNYEIVHLHSPTIGLFTLKFAKKEGIKIRIIHSHSTMSSPNKIKSFINELLIYNSKKYANKYFSCSREAALFLYGKNICKRKHIEIINNAVDTDIYNVDILKREKMKEELDLTENKVAIHVSNYSKIKNVNFLVPIIKETVIKDNTLKYIFVGDGPELENFKQMIFEKKLEKYVIFIGKVRNVQDYLQVADIFLLPSLKEGLPVSLIEAQACGVRCITNSTVTREANVGGITYLPLNGKEWEEHILKETDYSIEKRKKLHERLKNSNFNLRKEADRIQKIYLNLIR